jgi:hypothetical protein
MHSLYIIKFRQPPYIGASAHWGLFVPDPKSPSDDFGTPFWGTLFHATPLKGKCLTLTGQDMTRFEFQEYFHLSASPSLSSCLGLDNIEIGSAQVSAACFSVSQNRQFTYISRNCQEWVKEVLKHLIAKGYASEDVFEQIRLQGYVTLGETRCGKCAKSSSSSLKCNCR